MEGEKTQLPEGYTAYVMRESKRVLSSLHGDDDDDTENDDGSQGNESSREFYASSKFKEFTYWNLDKVPGPDDKFRLAMDWLDIAKVVSCQIILQEMSWQLIS